MDESALTTSDRVVEQALELRAQGLSWRACVKALDRDHRGLMRLVERNCPEAMHPHLSPESRRAYLAEKNAEYLDEAGRQLKELLVSGEIGPKAIPGTYKVLADAGHKFESRGVEKESFGDQLARSMRGKPPGKVTIIVEKQAEAIDVEPVEEE